MMQPGIYYPRLTQKASIQVIRRMLNSTVPELSKLASISHEKQFFYDQSKSIDLAELGKLRDELIEIAQGVGFPNTALSDKDKSKFDSLSAKVLYDRLNLLLVEAAADEVWNFFTMVVLPDLAKWRFPNTRNALTYERWLGTDRNVFRKLWWREATLGWELSSRLGEDQVVAIMERPRLSGNPDLARAMAGAFLRVSLKYGDVPREKVMRLGALSVRRRVPFIAFEALSSEQTEELVADIFEEAIEAYLAKDD